MRFCQCRATRDYILLLCQEVNKDYPERAGISGLCEGSVCLYTTKVRCIRGGAAGKAGASFKFHNASPTFDTRDRKR